jgi:RNA polymerase sigma-70 factor (ECF subfamily)
MPGDVLRVSAKRPRSLSTKRLLGGTVLYKSPGKGLRRVPEQARETVSTIFESWARPLLRYAICRTANVAVAEEVVQEAFLALYRKLVAGEEIDNPRAWTLIVVRHLTSKYRRDRARDSSNLADFGRLAEASSDIEEHLSALESLREALGVLTEREEQALLLRMESMRYGEIAKELQITSGTVATLLSRAALKIRKMREGNREKPTPVERRKELDRRSLQ